MGRKASMSTRAELIEATRARYEAGTRAEKQRILDEFVAVSGYHRKYAIQLLRRGPPRERSAETSQKPDQRRYTQADKEALILVWEAADRICGKRLKASLPVLVPAMEKAGHLDIAADVRTRLLGMSPATIDRLLKDVREHAGRGRRRNAAPAVAKDISLRTYAGWDEVTQAGWLEVDMVSHSGPSADGSFSQTLVATDIVTGWTEYIPLPVRESRLIVEALRAIMKMLPFHVRGIDTDNDTAFINETLLEFCQTQGITFTRSRAYRKNDQAWVEQKNGAIVRRLVGHDRYQGEPAVKALMRLYRVARLYENYFQPCFKLASKDRDGVKVTKRYYDPASPYQRLRDLELTPAGRGHLDAEFAELDPVDLLHRIRQAQGELASYAGRTQEAENSADLDTFVKTLASQWQAGEARATHKKRTEKRPRKRTVPDRLAEGWPIVKTWLEDEPTLTGRKIMERLQRDYPGQYEHRQLRTLQRRIKQWRRERANAMVQEITEAR